MLISFEHEFIFIHSYRTGGTSIEKALAPYSHDAERTLPARLKRSFKLPFDLLYPSYKRTAFYKHIRAKDLRKELPKEIYDRLFKFSIVRNPWDVQVSMYHYILGNSEHTFHDQVRKLGGLDQFVEWLPEHYFRLQKDFVTDDEGNLIVDYVGRFENLNQDFKSVCERLSLSADLEKINGSRHGDYRKYYADRSIELVAQYYKADVDYFGYTFE